MARADLLLQVVETASRGDRERFRRAVEALIAEEGAKRHHVLAKQLKDALSSLASGNGHEPMLGGHPETLVHAVVPERALSDLVLPSGVEAAVRRLVAEQHRVELLRAHALEPRNRVLLLGPPGNGKTSLAEAIATELFLPLYMARYEGVVGSYLGETAGRLAKVFDFARTRRCVFFLDEFDTLAKERGDEHETGEIKRVVSSLLLQIDRLPSHVVVIAATNHGELLDRAVWRRFQMRLELPPPTRDRLTELLRRFAADRGVDLGRAPRTLADHLHGASFAEVEEFAIGLLRSQILAGPESSAGEIAAVHLEEWSARAHSPA